MKKTPLKKTRAYGPDVYIAESGDKTVVEKTYRHRSFFIRLIGIIIISWEKYIYTKLIDIDGIPALDQNTDIYTLRTMYMGGENLRETKKVPDEIYFRTLSDLITRMHSKGVIHLDLRNRRNYGIDEDNMPYLVDFATCLYIPWKGRLKILLSNIDWMGFLKVKKKLRPDLISEDEQKTIKMGITLSNLWLPMKTVRCIKRLAKYFS